MLGNAVEGRVEHDRDGDRKKESTEGDSELLSSDTTGETEAVVCGDEAKRAGDAGIVALGDEEKRAGVGGGALGEVAITFSSAESLRRGVFCGVISVENGTLAQNVGRSVGEDFISSE